MNAQIRAVSDSDWESITGIFNHYVEHSFAAYPDRPVDESFVRSLRDADTAYPFVVAEKDDEVIGFAFMRPYHPTSTMRRTGVVTYFIHPDHTGRGIGAEFLDHLLEAGRDLGVENFLAHVSSLNPGSIRFHLKHGFTECGRIVDVGVKNGRSFDMVWLQKQLDS